MSEEVPSAYKPRSALGDVTNQVGKRGFPFVSSPIVKSGDGCKNDEGFQLAKKECIRSDNSNKENYRKEISEYVLKDSCISTSQSDGNGSHVIIEAEEDGKTDSVSVPQNPLKEKVENILAMGDVDGDGDGDDNLYSSKDEHLDCSKFPESQESRYGLERCIEKKDDRFSSTCLDSVKDCQCSFCLKAGYLWSDLHYEDIKGRIAVIKKSQKDASILVHQNNKDGAIGKYGQGNFEKFSNLESDLTSRWMSLFLHTEDMFVREGTQLEASLSLLKELRDNCKADSQEQ